MPDSYEVRYTRAARKQWESLDRAVRDQVDRKLAKRALHPHVPKDRLSGDLSGDYRIKLRDAGIRVVYRVVGDRDLVLVIAVGRRAGLEAYRLAERPLDDDEDLDLPPLG